MGLKSQGSVLTAANVRLIGSTMIQRDGIQDFLSSEGFEGWSTEAEQDGEILVEVAGRICYMSFERGRPHGDYIKNILSSGHGSVLEHTTINLLVTGVSRSFTHELVRHRAGAGFSQLSQRYVDESKCQFVVPPEYEEEVKAAELVIEESWPGALPLSDVGDIHEYADCLLTDTEDDATDLTDQQTVGLKWLRAMAASQRLYMELVEYGTRKVTDRLAGITVSLTDIKKNARQAARSVLPNATETKIVVTLNGRSIRHVLEMRGSPFADAEFRRVAVAMYRATAGSLPDILGDFEIYQHESAGECLRSKYKKV